jgi:hypothetical protein
MSPLLEQIGTLAVTSVQISRLNDLYKLTVAGKKALFSLLVPHLVLASYPFLKK